MTTRLFETKTQVRRPSGVAPAPEVLDAIRADLTGQGVGPEDPQYLTALADLGAGVGADRGHSGTLDDFPGIGGGTGDVVASNGTGGGADGTASAAPMGAPAAAPAARATKGSLKCLVLLVDFDDLPGTRPASEFQDLLFSSGTRAGGSLRDFYAENSGGQLDVDGTVVGWLRLPSPLTDYLGSNSGLGVAGTSTEYPHNAQKMVEDALACLGGQADIADFDADGDGHVDGLFVIHAGGGAELEATPAGRKSRIWSHQWTIPHPVVSNGVTADAYCTEPEDGKVGVFCHEFGHMLGLPDLYDTSYRSNGVGSWCVMGHGSWNGGGDTPAHFCAWAKQTLGWLTPRVVQAGQSILIGPVETTGPIYRLWNGGTNGKEYFLLENRQPQGFDSALPSSGLLIWHIDENAPDNTTPADYRVGLVQADGNRDLELSRNFGDDGDPYPGKSGNTVFSATSTPAASDRTGAATTVSVSGIDQSDSNIGVDVSV